MSLNTSGSRDPGLAEREGEVTPVSFPNKPLQLRSPQSKLLKSVIFFCGHAGPQKKKEARLIVVYKLTRHPPTRRALPRCLGTLWQKDAQEQPLPRPLRVAPAAGPGPGPDSELPAAGAGPRRLRRATLPSLRRGCGAGATRERKAARGGGGRKGPNPEITRMWSPRAHAQCPPDKLAATTRPWSSSPPPPLR